MIYNDPYLTRRKMVTLTLYQQQLTTWYDNYTMIFITTSTKQIKTRRSASPPKASPVA